MARDDELIARLAEIRRARDDAWSPALPARTNELAELVERVRGQRIGAEPLYEFLDTTVALTEPSAPGATKAIARLIQLLDWSNDDTRAEALALLETDLTAFRYAAQLWELENRDLPTLHAVPATVERSMAAFLESLARLEHRLAALEHLASHIAWLDRICQVLESERISARAEFSNRLWRRRLWILRKRALRLGLGGLTPSLTQVVLEDEDRSSDEAESTAAAAAKKLIAIDDSSGLAANVMSACVHDKLAPIDVELTRALVKLAPGQWAKAHLEALHADGFRAPVHLVKYGDSTWTAAPVFRVRKTEVEPARLTLGETGLIEARHLLPYAGVVATAKAEGDFEQKAVVLAQAAEQALSSNDLTQALEKLRELQRMPRHEMTDPLPEELALAHRSMPLAGLELELFGDDEGLWFRAQGHGRVVKGLCGESGAEFQFPLLVLGAQNAPPSNSFRAGPALRDLLRQAGQNVDRAYSPRAYLVPVGEGILRGLFGWEYREVSEKLYAEASRAGITTGEQLMASLGGEHSRMPNWFNRIPLDGAIREIAGANCWEELERSPEKLALLLHAGRIRSADPNLGSELDTLDPAFLAQDLKPVEGDVFVLMATATATSLLSARVIRHLLLVLYPSSRVEIAEIKAMRQRSGPLQTWHDTSENPLGAALDTAYALVNPLMAEGLDPVAVITSGLLWQSLALFMLAWDLRLPFVYRSGKGATIAVRCDMLRPPRRRSVARPERYTPPALPQSSSHSQSGAKSYQRPRHAGEAPKRWLVMNVALSLNYAWRDYARRKQVQEQSWGDDQQLRSWAGEQGNQLWRLCAELTMFEGWRPANAGAGEFAVALLASRASDPCRRALRVLFEEMGVEVAAEDDWLVQDFDEFPHDADFGQVRDLLRSQSFGPIERCLAATEERGGGVPDVAIGGQRLTAAILYMVARKQGCRTLFATDPGDIRGGANSPVLWQLQEGGNAEELSLVYRPRDDTGDRQAVVAEEQIFLPATEARAV